MKSKQQKRKEAEERQIKYDALTLQQKLQRNPGKKVSTKLRKIAEKSA